MVVRLRRDHVLDARRGKDIEIARRSIPDPEEPVEGRRHRLPGEAGMTGHRVVAGHASVRPRDGVEYGIAREGREAGADGRHGVWHLGAPGWLFGWGQCVAQAATNRSHCKVSRGRRGTAPSEIARAL